MVLLRYKFVKFLFKINLFIGQKISFMLSKYEAEDYSIKNKTLDLRALPSRIKNVLLHDKSIIQKRWDICSDCEFLTKRNRCLKCGCFMKVKTRVAIASCPVGKWGKEYDINKGEKVDGTPAPV